MTLEWMKDTSSEASCEKEIPWIVGKEIYDVSHDTLWHANLLCHLLAPCCPTTQLKLNLSVAWMKCLAFSRNRQKLDDSPKKSIPCWQIDAIVDIPILRVKLESRLGPLFWSLVLTIAFLSVHLRWTSSKFREGPRSLITRSEFVSTTLLYKVTQKCFMKPLDSGYFSLYYRWRRFIG